MESNCETKKAKRMRLEHHDWDWSEYAEPNNTKMEFKTEIDSPDGTVGTSTTEPKKAPVFTPIGCPSEWDCGSVPVPDSTTNLLPPGTGISKKKKNKLGTVDSRVNFHLAPGDVLVQCPYKICHLILETRFKKHLTKCRRNYLKECADEEVEVEIGICQWNAEHHLHFSKLAEHEINCPDQEGLVKIVRHFAGSDESNELVHYGKRNADWLDDEETPESCNSLAVIKNESHHNDHISSESALELYNGSTVKSEPISPGKLEPFQPEENLELVADDEIYSQDEEDWEAELHKYGNHEPAFNPLRAILENNTHYTRVPGGLTKSERNRFRLNQRIRYMTCPSIQAEGVLKEFPFAIESGTTSTTAEPSKSILKHNQ